ncbi:MAG: energy-coupling factor ABC transporter ATP-binding protein [Alphaproteobacteria bacterium]
MTAPPLFRLRGVSCRYGAREVLSELDFALAPGERAALLGGNGTGKTTLLHVMMGLVRPCRGTVEAFGTVRVRDSDFAEVRRRAGLLFQDADDQLFCPTVIEDVAFGPLNCGQSDAEARATAESVLHRLGIEGLADRVTHRLSGGEKRMVSLAAVLAMQPEVLLLDEPTNALDDDARERLIELLCELPQAMVLVTHEQALVERLGFTPAVLRDGRLAAAEVHRHPHVHRHQHGHIHLDPEHAVHEHHHPGPAETGE